MSEEVTQSAPVEPQAPVSSQAPTEPKQDVPITVSAGVSGQSPKTPQWTDGFSDDLKGYVENKGFRDAASVVDSYINLEKLVGVPKDRLLKVPEKLDDDASLMEIYNRLGRPEKADSYKVDVPEGGDKNFASWAQNTFHELGLTQRQGEALAAKWNEYVGGLNETATTENLAKIEADNLSLKKEWGAAYEAEVGKAKQAVSEFGLDSDTIDQLENAMGFAGVMKFFNKIGSKLGEGKFVNGEGSPSFNGSLTPQAAQARINALRQDSEFIKRFTGGDTSARDEMERLHKMAYPE